MLAFSQKALPRNASNLTREDKRKKIIGSWESLYTTRHLNPNMIGLTPRQQNAPHVPCTHVLDGENDVEPTKLEFM